MMHHISTDKSALDTALITEYLSNQSYWAKGRTKETVLVSIENSLCFGIYSENGNQVGFARVVTDYAVFAWIMDLFIVPAEQGKGLGKQLVQAIIQHPDLSGITRWGLNTKDAHGLYEQFGFTQPQDPSLHMEKLANGH